MQYQEEQTYSFQNHTNPMCLEGSSAIPNSHKGSPWLKDTGGGGGGGI